MRRRDPRCWRCYRGYALGEHGLCDECYRAPPPAHATEAAAGSEAKIAVLTERAARGEQLHHVHDSRQQVSPRDVGYVAEMLRRASRQHRVLTCSLAGYTRMRK